MAGDAFMKRSRKQRLLFLKEGEPGFRHILSFQAIRDGGIWVTPGAIPSAGWAMSRTSEYVGFGSTVGKNVINPRICAAEPRPKLHYHRSGWCTVQQPPDGERVGVHLPNLGSLSRHKIFELFQADPRSSPFFATAKRDDIFFATWGDWPDHLVVSGITIKRSELGYYPSEVQGLHAMQLVRGSRCYIVLDLWAHGLDQLIVLDAGGATGWAPGDGCASTSLTGMCTDGDAPSPMVSLYSNDGRPVVTRTMPWQMPQFPSNEELRSADRYEGLRQPDGTLIKLGDHV